MNKINLDVLFPGNKITSGNGIGKSKLDIDTLFDGHQELSSRKESNVSKGLLKTIERSREKRLKVMIDNYNICCEKIKIADANDLDFIFFTVPKTAPNCPKYSSESVLGYISKNLRKEYMDTVIMSDDTIFITWKDIELKKDEELEDKKRMNNDSSSD